MKHYLHFVFCLLIISACKNARHGSPTTDVPKEEAIPEALQEKSSSYTFSKRSGEDMVNELYQEQVQNDSALKKLEIALVEFYNAKGDSLEAFKKFDSKNQTFYHSANTNLTAIHDSTLLQEIKLLVEQSNTKYRNSIAGVNSLLKGIDLKTATIEELHVALKIVRTLPQIEAYQKKNLPPIKSIESVVSSADQIIAREKIAIKR